ncbi:MAG: hypothetical protein LBK25_03225 [Treponema sp.]|jgi:hypothetical protein|nr:hypothetical protein [Treponema sp.]
MRTLTQDEIDQLLRVINSTNRSDFDSVTVVEEQADCPTGKMFTQDKINEFLRESYIDPSYVESVDVNEFKDTKGKYRYIKLSGVYRKELTRIRESFWFTIPYENGEG